MGGEIKDEVMMVSEVGRSKIRRNSKTLREPNENTIRFQFPIFWKRQTYGYGESVGGYERLGKRKG